MDPFEDLGSLGRQLSGQKVCPKCFKSYNNRVVPQYCQNCNEYLGGRYVPKEKKGTDPHLITSTLASVRTNIAGVPIRTFVDVQLNKVNFFIQYCIYFIKDRKDHCLQAFCSLWCTCFSPH